jgi:type IV pilus assembly protein PilE
MEIQMYKNMYRKMRGVTLLELMIVVVVLGILAAIAYPNYRDFAARAKRNEAKAALLQIATNQERFYLNNNQFTNDLRQLGFSAANNVLTDTGSYVISIAGADNQTYTATATYQKADNEANKCNSFQIQANGNRASAPYTDCWTRTR